MSDKMRDCEEPDKSVPDALSKIEEVKRHVVQLEAITLGNAMLNFVRCKKGGITLLFYRKVNL